MEDAAVLASILSHDTAEQDQASKLRALPLIGVDRKEPNWSFRSLQGRVNWMKNKLRLVVTFVRHLRI